MSDQPATGAGTNPVPKGWKRSGPRFTDRIASSSTSAPGEGPDDEGRWPVEPGRYRLVASLACPWAHRSIIDRRLLGLEDAISLGIVDPIQDHRSWRFTLDPDGVDPVLGSHFLAEHYLARDPEDDGGVSVPALVDVPSRALVTNDYPQITLDLSTEWTEHHRDGAPDLYPQAWRDEIDDVAQKVFTDVNNGVYRAGFADGQLAYDAAYGNLFERLDWLTDRLEDRRYLVGDHITEADVRLFTTLVRFDAVYHGHFKCNRNKITEDRVLWAYARDLFQTPGFGDTVNFHHIKHHYYRVHSQLNPSGIVPDGPDESRWQTPHGREALGGSPFGDGTPPVAATDLASSHLAPLAQPVDGEPTAAAPPD
ncbi:glutathione S-transferase family protein [Cellulomonas sp. PhB143]|uniref:glutathione S-transferase family protein n=1 Tax=Cellulomonas sp. PhB143 TaxID=2485186 RepID=UPI000F49F3B9|nr:glutathione S-transferase C-terminal domain-containing protein [Cellulomonas sp. PhB143]ROS72075.1 putative glutathione S-transferase [Cellulomonas sp. PhB143]